MKNNMKFKDLKNGDSFECWGDTHLNYDYAKWCKCIKIDDNTGQEIGGINFLMNGSDEVKVQFGDRSNDTHIFFE